MVGLPGFEPRTSGVPKAVSGEATTSSYRAKRRLTWVFSTGYFAARVDVSRPGVSRTCLGLRPILC